MDLETASVLAVLVVNTGLVAGLAYKKFKTSKEG